MDMVIAKCRLFVESISLQGLYNIGLARVYAINHLMFRIIALSLLALTGQVYSAAEPKDFTGEGRGNMVIATYVSDRLQVSHALCLIRSLRENGGKYHDSEVFIVNTCPDLYLCGLDNLEGVRVMDSDMPHEYYSYPLAVKPFAAAQTERLVKGRDVTLAWFDPETIILSPPGGLQIKGKIKAVVQPVFLTNNISLLPGEPLNDFWNGIYGKTGVRYDDIPVVKSLIDGRNILAYYNCEIFSVNPADGICEQWAEIMDDLLSDRAFAFGICSTDRQKIFLHQAVLSAVIVSKAGKKGTGALDLRYGYPLHQHEKIPSDMEIPRLDNISCAILEDLWERNPSWMKDLIVSEPLKSRLIEVYAEFRRTSRVQ
jgi:hypothetical protein